MKHKPCLILNQDYTPLTIINWKRSLCLEIIGKEMPGEGVIVIEYYEDDTAISAGGEKFKIPAVAVTSRYIKRKNHIPLRKKNIAIRDNGECQYCGVKLSKGSTTIDHVKPKSHFKNKEDANTWENVVLSCSPCNTKKANKTPEQANMKLNKNPCKPKDNKFLFISPYITIPKEWKIYVRD
jgi:uncharacterized protein (TIGR02646 family)